MTITLRHKRAVKAIPESPCLKDALIKAGYSEKTAQRPKDVTESEGFQEAAKPLLDQLDQQIQAALDRMVETVKQSEYRDCSSTVDRLTKLKQLLEGKPTSNIGGIDEAIERILGKTKSIPNND